MNTFLKKHLFEIEIFCKCVITVTLSI